ncbi:MAG: hypothetical protein ACFUZC_03400 [Chthoniobacteraceae bacterium]
MDLRAAIAHCIRSLFFAAGSVGSTIAAWMENAWPILQFCLGCVSMYAAFASIRASMATCNAIKRQKQNAAAKHRKNS